MPDLPIELWHLIFDCLQLVDLSSCAQVSKAVYLKVKEYRIREIAFTRRVYEWFHYTTPTIDHKHRVDFRFASILRRSSFNFDYLKRLKIGRRSAIDLDVINKFTRLEELDIDLKNYENEKSWTLSLPNLKVLYLLVPSCHPYVELDTPLLAKVCTFDLKKLEFFFPESVQCIHTFYHSGKLSMFRNLEYLAFTDYYNRLDAFYDSQMFDQFSVTILKKLKEIDFYYFYHQYREKYMSVFKRITENLLALKRPDLKVFWYDVQVTDNSVLNKYQRMYESIPSRVAFQLKHYEKLKEKDQFFYWYDFTRSMRLLPEAGFNLKSEEFTSKFLARYSFRRIDVTDRVEERELLLKLIARSPDLFDLIFWNSGLGQSFFDRMADIIQLNAIPLQQLLFKGTSNESLNFGFVPKLRSLELFKTDQELSSGLMAKLLRLPSLVEIECSSGGISKRIERLSTNRFRLDGETLSLQKLLERFETKPEIQRPEPEASKCRLM